MILLLLFFLNTASVYFNMNDEITIEIQLNKSDECILNEPGLCGKIIFHNQSEKTLKVPKTFDLDIVLTDTFGTKIHRNTDTPLEYHNLIIMEKSISIKPNQHAEIGFEEWRLFLFDLDKGKTYNLQYVLKSNNYPRMRNALCGKELISNTVAFKYNH